MKKIIVLMILIIALIAFVIVFFILKNDNKEIRNNIENINNNRIQNNEILTNSIITEKKDDKIMNTVYIKINNKVLNLDLENNSSTIELKKRLINGDIVVNAHEYGGFEKVGDLGFSLPREDTNITTSAGDVVLYQGNQISLFYNSNSWSYTRIGKIQNISSNELKNILGNGDVTIIITAF